MHYYPMREHQRYFPVLDEDGNLLNKFITVRNGGSEHLDIVTHGNERVLRARLSDAEFFFNEDRATKLEDRLEKLKTVSFQEGLGNMYDKSERLVKMAEMLRFAINTPVDEEELRRCALLCKTDLVTGMVIEFTELQGVMGREYALLDGEKPEVATGIFEHYLPRFAGDALPATTIGRIVASATNSTTSALLSAAGLLLPVLRTRMRCAVRLLALSISCLMQTIIFRWLKLSQVLCICWTSNRKKPASWCRRLWNSSNSVCVTF